MTENHTIGVVKQNNVEQSICYFARKPPNNCIFHCRIKGQEPLFLKKNLQIFIMKVIPHSCLTTQNILVRINERRGFLHRKPLREKKFTHMKTQFHYDGEFTSTRRDNRKVRADSARDRDASCMRATVRH